MFSKEDIEHYFSAFKTQQVLLMVLAVVAFVIAVIFYAGLKTQWHRGFALPLAVFAMLFAGAGFSNYQKTDALKVRSIYNYDMHPELLKTKELPRIREQKQNLQLLIYINLSIIAASFLIFFYFRNRMESSYYRGAAASLFLMAALSVAVYFFMVKTLKKYEAGIEKFTEKIIVKEK